MDVEQARTFLAVNASGSFLEAAKRLHVTQSTVSTRIQNLEADLGARLFVRNRSGATLTQAGLRFVAHAKTLVLTLEQARHDVGLPSRYRGRIRIGGRIALWDGFLPGWVGWMRRAAADVAIRSEIGFEEDLMRRLLEGTLDIALLYTPRHAADLVVEHLFDETLVLVSSRPDDTGPGEDYLYVEWGPGFYARHSQRYPHLNRPPHVVNIGWLAVQILLDSGGSCFLPERMAAPLIDGQRLFRVPDSPEFVHPAYMVYARDATGYAHERAIEGLRLFAAEQPARAT